MRLKKMRKTSAKKVAQVTSIALLIALSSLVQSPFQVPIVSAWDNEYVHPHLCRESGKLLPAGSDMYNEIVRDHMDDITWGAIDEDENDVIYHLPTTGDALNTRPHFWDADLGPNYPVWLGMIPFHNAYEKSVALFEKALQRYDDGDMVHAYRLLGRVAHLIQDMCVPAHVHDDIHTDIMGVDDDCLEDWFYGDYASKPYEDPLWGAEARARGLIEFPEDVETQMRQGNWSAGLYYLMYTTNQVADYFASDSEDGDEIDPRGWMDYSGFPDQPTDASDLRDNDGEWIWGGPLPLPPVYVDLDNDNDGNLTAIVSCTIPYGIRAVTTLYKIFYELRHPPEATVTILPPADLDGDDAADHRWVRLYVTYDVGAPDYYRDLQARFRNEVGDWTDWEEVGAQPGGRIVSWMLSDGDGDKTVYYQVRNLMGLTNVEEAYATTTLRAWRVPLVFPYTITTTGAASVDIDLNVFVNEVRFFGEPEGAAGESVTCHWYLYVENEMAAEAVWPHNLPVTFEARIFGQDFVFSDIPVLADDKFYLIGHADVPATLGQPHDEYCMGSIYTDIFEVPRIKAPLGETTGYWIASPMWWDKTDGTQNPYWKYNTGAFYVTYYPTADTPKTESGEAYVEYGEGFKEVGSAKEEAYIDWTTRWVPTVDNPAIDYYMDGSTLYAKTIKTEPEMVLVALSPVDVEITDPMGNKISRHKEELVQDGIIVRYYVETNEIAGASILTTDLDGDGDPDTRFVFDEMAFGDYQIQVSPSVGEDPAETYSIALSSSALAQGGMFLSRDMPLAEIPLDGQTWTMQRSPTGFNLPPEAKANGPYWATEGAPVEFDASDSSDPDGDSLTYRWDFENDGTWDTTWSSSPTASHTWNDDWTGTAKVELSDGTLTDTSTATVTITNARPTADAGSNQLAAPGEEVQFIGSFTDLGVLDTHAVKWDFGDETTITDDLTPTHTYSEAGKYTVTLWVYDDDGGVGKDTLTVNTGVEIVIDPLWVVVPPEDSTTYDVLVHHLGTIEKTYNLFLSGLGPTWYSFSTPSVTLGPDQSESVALTVSPPFAAEIGRYEFTVMAASQTDPTVFDAAYADALVATAHDLGLEEIPPVTTLLIGQPEYVDPISGTIYVTSSTPFTLTAEDNPTGFGVASTFYHILNATHDTGKLKYTAPFSLAGLSDGQYSIVYYSKDYVANKEDAKSETVILDNTPPAITPVANPVSINTPITLLATVDDSSTGGCRIASAQCSVDGGDWISMNAVDGNFDEVTEDVTATLNPIPTPDVLTITLRGTDALGNGYQLSILLAVYDPAAGFVTGGGWINSPLGAYSADPTLTGKATFGFVSRYQKGANTPTGHTEFQFHAGDLRFQSTSYKWLVVAGSRAQFKGSGTINKGGNYGFMLTAIDGQINGGGGVDKFRIKIWDKATEIIIYDNQMDIADTDDPTTAIAGGSIVIHTK